MSKTVFTKVDYDLDTLMKKIRYGEIGLPHIQRPFVWKNTKVRDLFDSMYNGYPVGYLLFWENAVHKNERPIGDDPKQKIPHLLIVDGQQRLTALYAVIKSVQVVRKTYKKENIKIAFNPLEEKFEVADAATHHNKAYIPNISLLWDENHGLFDVVETFLEGLKSIRDLAEDEIKSIKNKINKLYGLLSFPFTALELSADIGEEAVSDVFVRINSKGTPLNQADFILTLMSVFWDEGRADLENFCHEARKPSKNKPSPYNHFVEPFPDQLLRVGVGVAFKRARLQYVYSILRGKDLETGEFDETRREVQFDRLKDAQKRVLNLQYWHDFLKCIHKAGFRSAKMISSQSSLRFSYILYLIGRTEYKVPEFELRQAIARWFFMSAVTGRFTSSPESTMEFDLARFRNIKTADEFLHILNRVCEITLTNDFWAVTLPNNLATSSPRSPSLFAYQAALVLLDAPALFSEIKVSNLLDPTTVAPSSAVQKHHLFPKAYLHEKGITSTRDTNQIANFALVEWGDNVKISKKPPIEYVPIMKARFKQTIVEQMYRFHALPTNWEHLGYQEFLEKRRELMAQIISDGYSTLSSVTERIESEEEPFDIEMLITDGESEVVEFKSTLRTNLHTNSKDPRIEMAVLKTLAGFMNTAGGTLIIGVTDNGSPVGLESDGFENEDKMSLHLINIVKERIGIPGVTSINAHFDRLNGTRILVVKCHKAPEPVYVKVDGTERFFIRTGPSTTELSPSQVQDYIKHKFGK